MAFSSLLGESGAVTFDIASSSPDSLTERVLWLASEQLTSLRRPFLHCHPCYCVQISPKHPPQTGPSPFPVYSLQARASLLTPCKRLFVLPGVSVAARL